MIYGLIKHSHPDSIREYHYVERSYLLYFTSVNIYNRGMSQNPFFYSGVPLIHLHFILRLERVCWIQTSNLPSWVRQNFSLYKTRLGRPARMKYKYAFRIIHIHRIALVSRHRLARVTGYSSFFSRLLNFHWYLFFHRARREGPANHVAQFYGSSRIKWLSIVSY